ncbi:hypothetical protein VCHA53O466_40092 [Vibrio chagasii]|nr:hypothetical protein VCHA53O466_40092 [Vibrio chagasii]
MKTLKEYAMFNHGGYEPKLSNLYLTFVNPKEVDGGLFNYVVTIRIPRPDLKGKFQTKTLSSGAHSSPEELDDFLSKVRAARDATFKSVFGKEFSPDAVSKIKKDRRPAPQGGTGQVGLRISKLEYHFKSMYIEGGSERYRNFPLAKYGSEDAAYVEARIFNDQINGTKQRAPEAYLAEKTKVFFPDFGTPKYEYQQRRLREVKEHESIDKKGIEISSDIRMVGFYANYFTELGHGSKKGQRRKSFNAKVLGEDQALVMACRAKDELDGNPILSDAEYLKLKPKQIFNGLLD